MKQSFKFAFKGALETIRMERNFRAHLAMTFYVLISAIVTRLSETEWILILICIGAVTGAEIFNTAIEMLCDALHPSPNKAIGIIKDMTAGAVLMFAISSAAIGGIIFFNHEKVARMLTFIHEHPAISVILFATVPVALYLVFRRYGNDNKISHDYNRGSSQRRKIDTRQRSDR